VWIEVVPTDVLVISSVVEYCSHVFVMFMCYIVHEQYVYVCGNTVVCDSCKAVSNTYEAFLDISLEVKVSTHLHWTNRF